MSIIKFNEIKLEPLSKFKYGQRPSSEDSRINNKDIYLVQIGGTLYCSKARKEWHGWLFHTGWTTSQLNDVERLWVKE